MSIRTWHRPSSFAVLLTLASIAIFIALGVWQIDRKAQKERFLAAFAAAPSSPTEPLAAVRDTNDATRYPHVTVAGHFVVDRGYLFDEQFHGSQPGVRVIALFAPNDDSRSLLVDRGWLAWNHAPGTTPTIPPLAADATQLTGIYAPYPGSGIRLGGDALSTQTTWPKLTLHIDGTEIASDLGKPILPRILLLDPERDSPFVREWTPNVLPPERHAAYAATWFTFAVVALIIFVALHWRKPDNVRP